MKTLAQRASQALEAKQGAERAAQHEKEMAQQWNANFQREVERAKRAAKRATHEKEMVVTESQEKLATEAVIRKEMQKEMERLYEEKIACEKELDGLKKDLKLAAAAAARSRLAG